MLFTNFTLVKFNLLIPIRQVYLILADASAEVKTNGKTEQVFPVLLTIIALYKVLKDDVKA